MGFKIGDKVKLIDCPTKSKIGKIGVIVKIYPPDSGCQYRVRIGMGWSCPMYEKEIEPVLKIGEQLLLFEL